MKRVSGGWRRGLIDIKHLCGQVILHFDQFLKLWDVRRNKELAKRCVERSDENNANVNWNTVNWDSFMRGFAVYQMVLWL
jgi:hypothetical protein